MKHIFTILFGLVILFSFEKSNSQPIIIDHNCSKLEPIPASAIINAKQTLHIAYGHTSHGSQLITGMTGLIGQTDLIGYKGDIYEWNEGGTGDALDIDDYFGSGDLGHNGDTTWAPPTRTYLADHPDVNVVIYSWCGGCSDNTYDGIQTYLDKMNELEQDFPNVTFVYMTGHTDIWSDAVLKANNQHIRDYCTANNKILYDFADIERYDPDGTYFEFTNDNCNYYDDESGSNLLGNWATEWQDTHTEGVDWYNCSAAHSQPLNGNLKAYAAWWLWCRLSGWDGIAEIDDSLISKDLTTIKPNPVIDKINIDVNLTYNSDIRIKLYDITGKNLDTQFYDNFTAGIHSFTIEANIKNGIYILETETKNSKCVKKIVVQK